MAAALALLAAALAALALVALRSYRTLRRELRLLTSFRFPVQRPHRLSRFTVADPYDAPGMYRKAQLHLHTSNSLDVKERLPVGETLERYRKAGYSFAIVTDHDRVTDVTGFSRPDFVVLTGEEKTVPSPIWPLGRHLLRLGVASGRPELLAPAHLSWGGNFETGCWLLEDLLGRTDYRLLEVLNGKSNSTRDFWLWHKALEQRGHADPVWGIAVDDTDNARPIDSGWVMVKTVEVSGEALLEALDRGCFYATNGASADFRVEDGVIVAEAREGAWIRFIDSRNQIVAAQRGSRGEYRPLGDEGFVRVEVTDERGFGAWSQPFFLVPEPGERE